MTAQDRGQLDEADNWYRRSLAINEELGNRPGMASTYHQLGRHRPGPGTARGGRQLVPPSLAITEELGNRPRHGDHLPPARQTSPRTGGSWKRPTTGTAGPWPSKKNSATGPAWRAPTTSSACTAQARGQLEEADDWYRQSLAINEELGNRPGMASHLPPARQHRPGRGQLEEADDWYRRSLTINEELGNRPGLAATYAQLGLLSEVRDQPELALRWNVRCVALFDEFPSRFTGTGPAALVRLTRQLGLSAVEQAWREVTGQALPSQIRDYLTSHSDEHPPGDQP